MVLGLGSKGSKGKGPPLQFDFEIRLLEIKPWHGLQSSKSHPPVVLLWQRGDRHTGSTKGAVPQLGTASEGGKIVFNESFKLPASFHPESARNSIRQSGNRSSHEQSLALSLVEANNPRGQPLARATVNLATYASIQDQKNISVPLVASKKVYIRGGAPNLLLTISPYKQSRVSGQRSNASSADLPSNSPSSKVSEECSSTLDEQTQDSLVAALLSDEEDEIASFTDDESPGECATQLNVAPARAASDVEEDTQLLEATEMSISSMTEERLVKKAYEVPNASNEKEAVSLAVQAAPVKAAAAVAATAYIPKRPFLPRDGGSSRTSSNEYLSEPASPGEEDGFFTPNSYGGASPSLSARSPVVASLASSHTSVSNSGSDSIGSDARARNMNTAGRRMYDAHRSFSSGEQLRTGSEMESWTEADSPLSETSKIKASPVDDKGMKKEAKEITDTAALKPPKVDEQKPKDASAISKPLAGAVEDVGTKNIKAEVERTVDEAGVKPSIASASPTEAKQNQKLLQVKDLKSTEVVVEKQSSSPAERKSVEKMKVNSRSNENKANEMKGNGAVIDDSKAKQATQVDNNAALPMKEMTALEEARMRFAKNAEERNSRMEKKALEDAKVALAQAEAKVAVAEEKIQQLELQVEKFKGELQDAAAIEAALYSVVAEHGSSSHKVHSPARRLARLYIYACKHWSQERRARSARNSIAGLVLVVRACGHDVPRLTFWWSNAVVLRETISLAFDVLASGAATASSRSNLGSAKRNAVDVITSPGAKVDRRPSYEPQESKNLRSKGSPCDWREPSTFTTTLERVEAWIYAKVVESVWWQALTPHMQKSLDSGLQQSVVDGFREETSAHVKRSGKKVPGPELGDGRQGNISIDLWKKAFSDSFERLCPVQAVGVDCGCLPMLAKMIIEECAARLDVAIFNAVLRGSEDEAPTDPISDPISDPRVLPIPIGNLTFGAGAQLKNAVHTWSTWLTNLLSKDNDDSMDNHRENDQKGMITFPLLTATGDLLMLPKEMLMDKSVRKEVCPGLTLPLIRRILLSFIPDEFSPEPATPSLLAAINAEISAEERKYGKIDCCFSSQGMALAHPIMYSLPQSSSVKEWIGDQNSKNKFGRSKSSVLRKGHTSDDELDELESPVSWLVENSTGLMDVVSGHMKSSPSHTENSYTNGTPKGTMKSHLDETTINCRFHLLREVWRTM